MKELNLTPARPMRYIYHVTGKGIRAKIRREGLRAFPSFYDKKPAVFAHNSAYPDITWFPFCFDEMWEWDLRDNIEWDSWEWWFQHKMMKYGYDFWRIDTKKVETPWYIDRIGMKDFYKGVNYPFLIMTFGDIPPEAIQLYNFHEDVSIYRTPGVAHIQGYFRAA